MANDNELIEAVNSLSHAQWHIGDLGVERVADRGAIDARREVDTMADTTRLSPKTIRRYINVSEAYGLKQRRLEVPWSIHRVLSAAPNRHSLINQAAKERWTYVQAVAAVRFYGPPKDAFDVAIEALEAAHDKVLVTLAALRDVGPLSDLQRDLLRRAAERVKLPLDWAESFLHSETETWEEGLARLLND